MTVTYGSIAALREVDFAVTDGQGGVGVIGESGSGKTTLLRALVGLVKPTSGQVCIQGQDISLLRGSKRSAFRATVQPVFQEGSEALDPRMLVGASIAEALGARDGRAWSGGSRHRRHQEVTDLLDAVSLPGSIARSLPHELSGGQRQRVVIARALAMNPRLMVLDEPTSALDVTIQAKILELVETLIAERALSVVLITHNLAVVKRICASAHVMFAGRIIESGPSDSLLGRPRHPYTQILRAAVPVLGAALPAPGGTAWGPASTSGCAFRSRCPFATQRCALERPELRPVDGHLVACHNVKAANSAPPLSG